MSSSGVSQLSFEFHVVGIHRAVYFDNDLPVFHLHSRLSSNNPTVQEATESFLRRYLPASSFVP
jgi:hypothetical protein